MLLYGTEEPAQPSDQRYGPYTQTFHRPISGIGQQTNSQVGKNSRRVNGGNNKNAGGGTGWPGWFTGGGNVGGNRVPSQQLNTLKKTWNNVDGAGNNNNGAPQFSSNNIFGNFIRHLSRIVNSRRD